jgi:hypothetical protein
MKNLKLIIEEYENKGPKFHLKRLEKDILPYINELPCISDDILEDFYLVKESLNSIPKCLICNANRKFKNYKKGYYSTCNDKICKDKHTSNRIKSSFKEKYGVENPSELRGVQQKRENTFLKKYGVKNPYQSEEVKDKIKETWIKNYGVDNPKKSKEIQEKIKSTLIERYCVDNPYQIESVLSTIKEKYGDNFGFGSEYFKEKSKETNLDRYGREEFLSGDEIHDVISKTMEGIYGGRGMASEKIKDIIENTNLKKYGTKYPARTKEVQDKRIETCNNKYGCEHHMQNIEVFEKFYKKVYKKKQIKFPSGRIESVQGYEPQAINELLSLGYDENDIVISNKDIEESVGKIFYIDSEKKRRYYPDIYIKSENKIIEVKSKYTFESHKTINKLKEKACIDLGFNFEFKIIEV